MHKTYTRVHENKIKCTLMYIASEMRSAQFFPSAELTDLIDVEFALVFFFFIFTNIPRLEVS